MEGGSQSVQCKGAHDRRRPDWRRFGPRSGCALGQLGSPPSSNAIGEPSRWADSITARCLAQPPALSGDGAGLNRRLQGDVPGAWALARDQVMKSHTKKWSLNYE